MKKAKIAQHWKKQLVGKWQITFMPDFTKKDVNEEGPASFEVKSDGSGEFRFLLVQGNAYGDFKNNPEGPVFDFTWDGSDECDEASGDGWMQANPEGKAEGGIRFHGGDTYKFRAAKSRQEEKTPLPKSARKKIAKKKK